MSDSIPNSQVVPSVRLSSAEWQKHKDRLWKVQQEADDLVYKELNESFKNELYSSSFDPLVCYNEANAIIEFLYGEFHSKPVPVELSGQIARVRSLYDKLIPPTFPKTTFMLILWGLDVVDCGKCNVTPLFRRLFYDLNRVSNHHEKIMGNYWRSKAINHCDPSTLNGLDIQSQLTDPTLSGPEKARLLRRFWPDLVERGLIVLDDFIDGSEIHLTYQTFAEVEAFFSNNPTMTVLQFVLKLGIDHLAQDGTSRSETGLQSIDLKWRRQSAGESPKPSEQAPAFTQYPPGTIPPISLLNPASWSPYLTPRQIENFQSCECSPAGKARLLKILWGKTQEVGVIVPFIPGTLRVEGVLIECGFITFPQCDIPLLERFFTANPGWSALTFAKLLGFCLRHKESHFLGGGTSTHDRSQEVNYWIASKIKTAGQAVKNMKRIWAAWKDEELVMQPRQHLKEAA